MNKREAAIVSAYTGFLCGNFADMHEYVEEVFGYPIFTHQFGDKEFFDQIHEKTKNDFINLKIV
jgi:hypothetical protein